MHTQMATKALMQARYTEGLYDFPEKEAKRVRELLMSGWADYKGEAVTNDDRELACKFMSV
jgi:hypothetical protein